MPDSNLNIVSGRRDAAPSPPGDVPEHIRDRYLIDAGEGPGLGFYVDASVQRPAFRDQGSRLTTDSTEPDVIRDLMAISRHRGWSAVAVRGETAFRREAWTAAQTFGLEVHGYRPTKRDRAAANTHEPRTPPAPIERATPAQHLEPELRRRVVEAVIRERVADPEVRARLLAAVQTRLGAVRDRPHGQERAHRR